jgi:hypothetical protein
MPNYDEIKDIARASLMPDFFAVRIEEEGLFADLQQVIGKIKLATPLPQLERIKRIVAASSSSTAFIDALKEANLWSTLRDLLTHVQLR